MKKHIANIITGSRIVFSVPLMFLPLSSTWFYVLYLFCGFTDMIDGTIARKTGTVSEFGARLDTVADFVFLSASLAKFLPMVPIPQWLGMDRGYRSGQNRQSDMGICSYQNSRLPSYCYEQNHGAAIIPPASGLSHYRPELQQHSGVRRSILSSDS